MAAPLRIGLVGDHDEAITAHRAIPLALSLAASALDRELVPEWLPTERIDETRLKAFGGLWCVPGSPYRSLEGALQAIRFAREQGVPFLGSCGGFQHAVLEYARHVLGWGDASHAESDPGLGREVVAPLACPLIEANEQVQLVHGSRIAAAYGELHADAVYLCRYGVNPAFAAQLTSGPLRATAFGAQGEIRAVELDGHPFFMATLFQGERAALMGHTPPLALALARAVVAAGRSASCC